MQTTLLGLAIAFILALVAALVGPYFVDWNQFRPQFEAEATRVVGAPVRVSGGLEARAAAGAVAAAAVDHGGQSQRSRQDPCRQSRCGIQPEFVDARRMARDRTHHRRRCGRSRPQCAGAYRTSGFHRAIQSWRAGDRPVERHRSRPHSMMLRARARSNSTTSPSAAMFAHWRPAPCAVMAISCCRARVIRSVCPPGRPATATARALRFTVDPGEKPLSVDLDGVLNFDNRTPRFDGALTSRKPGRPEGEWRGRSTANAVARLRQGQGRSGRCAYGSA